MPRKSSGAYLTVPGPESLQVCVPGRRPVDKCCKELRPWSVKPGFIAEGFFAKPFG